jgi:CRISPR-associated protein (TIGR03984 family)
MTPIVKPITAEIVTDQDLQNWLGAQLNSDRPYLLAFADDGVIWGRKVEDLFVTSHKIDPKISPELCKQTLQQAYIFGPKDEIFLFRDEIGEWKILHIKDGEEIIIESQILWGDLCANQPENGFTRMHDKTKGIVDQIFPLEVDELGTGQLIRLDIHHNIEYDGETGEARISVSRLAGLRVGLRVEVVK